MAILNTSARFEVEQPGSISTSLDVVILRLQNWNDWFKWRTSFYAYYKSPEGQIHEIGAVKIGRLDHGYANSSEYATPLPTSFDRLDNTYVSIGQDESYYVNMRKLLGPVRAAVAFDTLGDLAYRPERLEEFSTYPLVNESLLRHVDRLTATSTLPRLARGQGLAAFEFIFNRPAENPFDSNSVLDFAVIPSSKPPTNVHVLIGRNGSGKTTMIKEMAVALLGNESGSTRATLLDLDGNNLDVAGIVYVSFSAFDRSRLFLPEYDDAILPVKDDANRYKVRYSYVGLLEPKTGEELSDGTTSGHSAQDVPNVPEDDDTPEDLTAVRNTRSPDALADSFADSAWIVVREKSRDLWRRSLDSLESDTIFRDANIPQLIDMADTAGLNDFKQVARDIYEKLSSGHKIVLLTVTRLVQTVSDRSLVLLDEPEGHLHPPLLSALIRTLSNLMAERNGIAIVATHSPVILQEVPRKCAWRINRTSNAFRADRLEVETFGENVGALTTSVFGLEVADSGFHKLLIDTAAELRNYDGVLARFGNELGSDARALLHSWFTDQRIPTTSYDARRAHWTPDEETV